MKDLKNLLKDKLLKEINVPDQYLELKEKLGIKKCQYNTNNGALALKFKNNNKVIIGIIAIIIIITISIFASNYLIKTNSFMFTGLEITSSNINNDETDRPCLKYEIIDNYFKPEIDKTINFYAKKGEVVNIAININNLKDIKIINFTLNGKTYYKEDFVKSIDPNKIVINYKVMANSGIEELILEDIHFEKHSQIFKYKPTKNYVARIGVLYDGIITASSTIDKITSNSITISAILTDASNILKDNDELYILVSDGLNIVSEEKLAEGVNQLTINNLAKEQIYEYFIVAIYDALDGNGKCAHIISETYFKTI